MGYLALSRGHAHAQRWCEDCCQNKASVRRRVSPATMSNHHSPSLLDGTDLTEPDHKGYLFKQSRTHTGFNRRYGVLYKKLLVYYENEEHFKRDAKKGTLEVGL